MFKSIVQSDETHKRFSFEAHGVDLAVINGIRRVILTDIPVVGFQGEDNPSLTILVNNGPLHNEFMLHRLGLIPIHMSEEETETFDQENYIFELDVHNDSANMKNVTTREFSVKNTKTGHENNTAVFFPADALTGDNILVTRLRPGEHLHVKGHAVKDTARTHSGFSPVSLCTFSFMTPTVAGDGKSVLDRERAYYKNDYGEPTAILFSIESETALSPRYLVDKALQIIVEKLRKFLGSLTAPEGSEDVARRTDIGVEFHIPEDDTVGNILQSQMHNYYIREKHGTTRSRDVTYVGYYAPHPLETSVVVKMCCADHDDASTEEYIDTMMDACGRIISDIEHVRAEWNAANEEASKPKPKAAKPKAAK
jgi:DNA-directed RNA polymerase subunit L